MKDLMTYVVPFTPNYLAGVRTANETSHKRETNRCYDVAGNNKEDGLRFEEEHGAHRGCE